MKRYSIYLELAPDLDPDGDWCKAEDVVTLVDALRDVQADLPMDAAGWESVKRAQAVLAGASQKKEPLKTYPAVFTNNSAVHLNIHADDADNRGWLVTGYRAGMYVMQHCNTGVQIVVTKEQIACCVELGIAVGATS